MLAKYFTNPIKLLHRRFIEGIKNETVIVIIYLIKLGLWKLLHQQAEHRGWKRKSNEDPICIRADTTSQGSRIKPIHSSINVNSTYASAQDKNLFNLFVFFSVEYKAKKINENETHKTNSVFLKKHQQALFLIYKCIFHRWYSQVIEPLSLCYTWCKPLKFLMSLK